MKVLNKIAMVGMSLMMLTTAQAKAESKDYFYFWTESYDSMVDVDGTTLVSVKLKTSESGKYDLSVNEKIIAKDYFIFEKEVTEFPIVVSNKYTQGDFVYVCALKQNPKVEFENQICLKIKLVK